MMWVLGVLLVAFIFYIEEKNIDRKHRKHRKHRDRRERRVREDERRVRVRQERKRLEAIGTYSFICPKCGEGWKLYCHNCNSPNFDGNLQCLTCKEQVSHRICACGCTIHYELFKRTDTKQEMLLIDALYRNSDKQKDKEIVKKLVKYRNFNYLWVFNALESKNKEKLEKINREIESIDSELFNRKSVSQKMLLGKCFWMVLIKSILWYILFTFTIMIATVYLSDIFVIILILSTILLIYVITNGYVNCKKKYPCKSIDK